MVTRTPWLRVSDPKTRGRVRRGWAAEEGQLANCVVDYRGCVVEMYGQGMVTVCGFHGERFIIELII